MSYINKMDITLDCGCLGEQEFTIEYEYTYSPETGRTGNPENYDPGTEELDILEAVVIIGGKLLHVDIEPSAHDQDRIMELAREQYAANNEERREDYEASRSLYRECE